MSAYKYKGKTKRSKFQSVGNKLAGVLFKHFGYVVVFSVSLMFFRKAGKDAISSLTCCVSLSSLAQSLMIHLNSLFRVPVKDHE